MAERKKLCGICQIEISTGCYCEPCDTLSEFKKNEKKENYYFENWRNQGGPKSRKHGSYLNACPEMGEADFEQDTIPIKTLKNGNISSLVTFEKQQYFLHNTCAFDALSQIMAAAYCDSNGFNLYVSQAEDPYLQFIKMMFGKKNNVINLKRLEILMEKFGCEENVGSKFLTVKCQTTIYFLANKILQDLPSCIITQSCEFCGWQEIETRSIMEIFLVPSELHDLQNSIMDQIMFLDLPCKTESCKKPCYRSVRFSEQFLLISPFDREKHTMEILATLDQLPKKIELRGVTYKLRGAIGLNVYSKKVTFRTVGHFKAFCFRNSFKWEMYDDNKPHIKNKHIPSTQVIRCNGLFYSV